ncbi:hypothetical protein ACQUSY_13205 [Microbacterium sp. YY-03]|uniref:hypothetical protein n=1 Tax=Microbacterium sp. YY-03 TaxID=3421636 RepID=UPI003D17443E
MPKPQRTITITTDDMRAHGRDVTRYLMTTPTMLIAFAVVALACIAAIIVGATGPPPSFGPVAVRVVGFRLMGALPSVVDGCEVAER